MAHSIDYRDAQKKRRGLWRLGALPVPVSIRVPLNKLGRRIRSN
jgi:hypothetical protein